MAKFHCLTCTEGLYHEISWEILFNFKPLIFSCLCRQCQKQLQLNSEQDQQCKQCQQDLEQEQSYRFIKGDKSLIDYSICGSCKANSTLGVEDYLQQNIVYEYNPFFKAWWVSYKDQGDFRMAQVMNPKLNEIYQQYRDCQWLAFPESEIAFKKRGFHTNALLLDSAKIPYHLAFTNLKGPPHSAATPLFNLEGLLEELPCEKLKVCKKWLIFDAVNTDTKGLVELQRQLCKLYHHWDLIPPDIICLILAQAE